jgi:hypothetical protein
MNDPRCKRFYRHYEEFGLCVNIGDKEYVLAEHPNERYTIFYYGVYGSGKLGRIFESDYITIESKKIVNVQDYLNDSVVFQSQEDFYLIGFNTPDKNIKWDAKLWENKENKLKVDKRTILLCLNGNFLINEKKFKRFDYSVLEKEKEYNIDFLDNESALGLFSHQNL